MSSIGTNDKNQIFTKAHSVTNKNKILFALLAVFCVLVLAIFASYLFSQMKETRAPLEKSKPKIQSNATLPATTKEFLNRQIPDYIEQIKSDKNNSNLASQNEVKSTAPSAASAAKIGDADVNSLLNEKQLEIGALTSDTTPEKVSQKLKTQTLERQKEEDEIYLGSKKKAPKSPYELIQGTNIPAILESGINSDIAGYANAVVRQNVYDTVTGTYLLIPKGTKIFGSYENKVMYGQSRLLVKWNRLIFADGSSILIRGMDGSDKEGYSGFSDEVNNHFANLLSGAVLMSIIGTAAQLSQPQTSTGVTPSQNEVVGQTLAGQAGTNISQTSAEIVKRNLNVSPTIEIRPGYEFNIIVNKDLILEPITDEN